jgi:hypothetical protein
LFGIIDGRQPGEGINRTVAAAHRRVTDKNAENLDEL